MNEIKQLAEKIRSERRRRHWSQQQLATLAGIPLRTYQRLEAGDRGTRLDSLILAMNALGLGLTPSPKQRPTLDDLEAIYGRDDHRETAAG